MGEPHLLLKRQASGTKTSQMMCGASEQESGPELSILAQNAASFAAPAALQGVDARSFGWRLCRRRHMQLQHTLQGTPILSLAAIWRYMLQLQLDVN